MEEKYCCDCKTLKSAEEFYKFKKYLFKRCIKCDLKRKFTYYECECGKYYTYTHKQRHFKSNYHINTIKDIQFRKQILSNI